MVMMVIIPVRDGDGDMIPVRYDTATVADGGDDPCQV